MIPPATPAPSSPVTAICDPQPPGWDGPPERPHRPRGGGGALGPGPLGFQRVVIGGRGGPRRRRSTATRACAGQPARSFTLTRLQRLVMRQPPRARHPLAVSETAPPLSPHPHRRGPKQGTPAGGTALALRREMTDLIGPYVAPPPFTPRKTPTGPELPVDPAARAISAPAPPKGRAIRGLRTVRRPPSAGDRRDHHSMLCVARPVELARHPPPLGVRGG